ncbi:MAG: DUF2303 family protein [Tetrasphaera sp.]|nr:DUF2303 family protein [Tetrasphaera sp.]
MLELAQTIKGHTKVSFESSKHVKSGETAIEWREETTAAAGKKGTLEIPDTIDLGMQVYEGGVPYKLTARFRYRIGGGAPSGYVPRRAATSSATPSGRSSGRLPLTPAARSGAALFVVRAAGSHLATRLPGGKKKKKKKKARGRRNGCVPTEFDQRPLSMSGHRIHDPEAPQGMHRLTGRRFRAHVLKR